MALNLNPNNFFIKVDDLVRIRIKLASLSRFTVIASATLSFLPIAYVELSSKSLGVLGYILSYMVVAFILLGLIPLSRVERLLLKLPKTGVAEENMIAERLPLEIMFIRIFRLFTDYIPSSLSLSEVSLPLTLLPLKSLRR